VHCQSMAQKAERATDEAHAQHQAHESAKQEAQRLVTEIASVQAACACLQKELQAVQARQKVSIDLHQHGLLLPGSCPCLEVRHSMLIASLGFLGLTESHCQWGTGG
jgi:hypothetical protein